jgi:hypothetical protein
VERGEIKIVVSQFLKRFVSIIECPGISRLLSLFHVKMEYPCFHSSPLENFIKDFFQHYYPTANKIKIFISKRKNYQRLFLEIWSIKQLITFIGSFLKNQFTFYPKDPDNVHMHDFVIVPCEDYLFDDKTIYRRAEPFSSIWICNLSVTKWLLFLRQPTQVGYTLQPSHETFRGVNDEIWRQK